MKPSDRLSPTTLHCPQADPDIVSQKNLDMGIGITTPPQNSERAGVQDSEPATGHG